jgi:diacylglycerol kinase (ATP)
MDDKDRFVKRSRSIADLTRVWNAARYSLAGLRATAKHEAAFRQELVLFAVLAPLGAWLGHTGAERALLIGSLVLVLIVEILNSGLEALVDRVGTEKHKLSGRAKDMGSAAVMLSLMNVVIVWGLVLFSP